MNAGTELGTIPAEVSVRLRLMVAAGLANEVEAVNQQAAPIQAPTAQLACWSRPVRARVTMTRRNPAVATTSPISSGAPVRFLCEGVSNAWRNMASASAAPAMAPAIWQTMTAAAWPRPYRCSVPRASSRQRR